MPQLSADAHDAVEQLALSSGFSAGAVETLLYAVAGGGGTAAQFNHPEFGGMGQWSQGGMIMIGDMFNNGLKDRVARLCAELAALVHSGAGLFMTAPPQSQSQSQGGVAYAQSTSRGGGQWWPEDLGEPSSAGSQNAMRYAFFPGLRRLAVERDGKTVVYDTGDHAIGGFSQQQGGGQSLSFSSQHGPLALDRLRIVSGGAKPGEDAPVPSASQAAVSSAQGIDPLPGSRPADGGTGVFAAIEGLHELHKRGILSDEEYAAKKRELLSRV